MRMLDELARSTLLLADVVGRRVRRPPDDPAVRALCGAVIGVGIAVWLTSDRIGSDYVGLMDQALAELEAGFPDLTEH
jgi:hypothetical protein